jgi:enolase
VRAICKITNLIGKFVNYISMRSARIAKIKALEILDSRGNPTLETRVILNNGAQGVACVPSGASKGRYEALELRDGDLSRYNGKGVLKACENVSTVINKLLCGYEVLKQQDIDEAMILADGTENKSRLGANAILSVSLACSRAGAKTAQMPLYKYLNDLYQLKVKTHKLPVPMMNIINGGAHAGWNLDIQEFLIMPQVFSQDKENINMRESVRQGVEIFHALGKALKHKGGVALVGDEGGYAPCLKSNEEAFSLLALAVKAAGYSSGALKFGIDAASSEFFNSETHCYELKLEHKKLTASELGALYQTWIKKYPLISLEDPFAEDNWEAWKDFTKKQEREDVKTLIIGDDLFSTNKNRLERGIKERAANAIIIKPNQIGTLTETIECCKLAQKHGLKIIVSHRSGETSDDFIADLAVAIRADFIKAGAPCRGERVAKYNRLMEIEDELGR